MSPDQLHSAYALAMGFAFAGLMSSGYQVLAEKPASFRLLSGGPSVAAFVAVPFLVFAAPFIITRNIVRAGMSAPQRVELVMVATVFAGVWSMMSGTVVVMALREVAGLLV
jgi:hypothetical protein